jgi:hypothetical protein
MKEERNIKVQLLVCIDGNAWIRIRIKEKMLDTEINQLVFEKLQ